MMYLFHGTDSAKVRAKAFAWVAATRAKVPDAPYIRMNGSELSHERIAEAVSSQGLFFSKTLILIDDPFATTESGDIFLESLDTLRTSRNPVAVLAPKLLAARVKKIEGKAEKVFKIDATEKKEACGFNSALVNALGEKNKELLWKEIVKALRAGEAPEALHGLLHWKARDMMQKGNRVWGKEGARKLSVKLIEIVSDSRAGDLTLKENLERFALSLR